MDGSTPPLTVTSHGGHTDIVAFLLKLPAVKPSVDAVGMDYIAQNRHTGLSCASANGHWRIVQLLLDASADPTVPDGDHLPLNESISNGHDAIAALLRLAIAESDRARALHKARSLLGAGAAALAWLQGRVEQGKPLPRVERITPQQQQEQQQQQQHEEEKEALQQQHLQQALQQLQEHQHPAQQLSQQLQRELQLLLQRRRQQQQNEERLRETAAFAVGVSGREKDTGLCEDLYLKLLGYMLPAWADKGPAEVKGKE